MMRERDLANRRVATGGHEISDIAAADIYHNFATKCLSRHGNDRLIRVGVALPQGLHIDRQQGTVDAVVAQEVAQRSKAPLLFGPPQKHAYGSISKVVWASRPMLVGLK